MAANSGKSDGENPRRIFLHGKEYPVEYVVYKYRKFDIETEAYADVFKLSLKNYGECEIFYKHKLDEWEREGQEKPEKSFADMAMEKKQV